MHSNPSRRTATSAAPRDVYRDTLTATEAARELGIQKRTLYAYVSRGLIPSIEDPGRPRERRYPAVAVRRLKAYRAAQRDPSLGARAAARGALAWGEPVLESAITLINSGSLYYRGHDVLELAAHRGFEQVAELLWIGIPPVGRGGGWPSTYTDVAGRSIVGDAYAAWSSVVNGSMLPPIAAAQVALPIAAALDDGALDRDPRGMARAGRSILELLTQLAVGPERRDREGSGGTGGRRGPHATAESIAKRLALAWAPRHDSAASLFDAALILVADHELNAAALAARVVASTGGSPYAVVAAGLAALEGPGHGGDTARIQVLLDRAAEVAADAPGGRRGAGDTAVVTALRRMVRARIRRGERIPGFGHRLYPSGDPRARFLLDRISAASVERGSRRGAGSRVAELASSLVTAVRAESGDRPTVDYALAVVARVTDAPVHAPLTLFALGRSAGLVAHAIEQYGVGRVLRARARYIGAPIRVARDGG